MYICACTSIQRIFFIHMYKETERERERDRRIQVPMCMYEASSKDCLVASATYMTHPLQLALQNASHANATGGFGDDLMKP